MIRRPFLIFATVVSILVAGSILFIQSQSFANLIKGFAAKHIPADLGIEGDFSEFAVRLFPPGISIKSPRIVLLKDNVVGLPAGSTVRADRMDLMFRPFQMFTGNIRVHNVVVVNGEVKLELDKTFFEKKQAKKASGLKLRWDELLQIRAEAISLENTQVSLSLKEPGIQAEWTAQYLSVAQWSGRGGAGYEAEVDLKNIHANLPKSWKIPGSIDSIHARARGNALGVQIDELAVSDRGVEAKAFGSLRGNILNSKGVQTDVGLSLKGDLAEIFQYAFEKKEIASLPLGNVRFEGKVTGDLDRPAETLAAAGKLEATDLKFKAWEADKAAIEGSWTAGAGGGEIAVTKAEIEAAERPKRGGHQPGRGGKIEAGAFRYRFGQSEPIHVPLTLDRAHIHWLVASELKSVYPLDFRVSGPVEADFVPRKGPRAGNGAASGWELDAKLGLRIRDFVIDNQKLGETKPMTTVLHVAELALDGGVVVDASGLRPDGLKLKMPHSEFQVTGKVDAKTGCDLQAAGSVDLADVGQLAETDIRGEGLLSAHVHGPGSRVVVDFDADLKDALYLNLKLGNLRGRVTWDENPDMLYFKDAQFIQGRTQYTANGQVNIGKTEAISLDVGVPKGRIQDFIVLFQNLTKDFWWFPHRLVGDVGGSIRVSGGIHLDKLQVLAKLSGSNWDHLGERFRQVSFTGGYDKGKYHAESIRLTKHSGTIVGRFSFDENKRYDWDLRTDGMEIGDLDHVAALDVPIRGNIYAESMGRGKEGALESRTRATLTEVFVRGVPMPPSEALLASSEGVASFKAVALGGQGTLEGSYDFKPRGQSYLRGELHRLDFSPILLLLNPRSIQDHELAGSVTGALDLSFRSTEIERATGKVELDDYLLAKAGTRFQLAHPVVVRMDHGNFNVDDLALRGNHGEAKLSLRSRDTDIDGTVSGELDLSAVEFLTSAVQKASGSAALDFSLSGKLKEPKVAGKATVSSGTVKIPSLEAPFENVAGTLLLRQNLVTVQSLEADLANGRVGGSGTIELFADRYPTIALSGTLAGNKLKVYPFQFVKVRGRIRVHGDDIPYLVDGNVSVDSALSREKVLGGNQGRSLKSAKYMPPATFREESNVPKFKLNIDVVADGNVLVQNDLFDAEAKGNLTLVNTLDAPRVVGTAEIVQGKMIFKDRVFQIQSADMNFDNPAVINPRFNLTATTDVSSTRVQIYASGRLDKPKIELTSNPSMPEAEIIQLLALGLSPDEVKRLRTGQSSAFEQGEAASLLLHSLDFNRDLQNKTGIQLELDEAVDPNTAASSAFRPKADADSVANPKIVIKRKLIKQVDLSVGSTVGVGTSNQREVNAEWKLNPNFSVIGVYDNVDNSAAGGTPNTSMGVDIKYQKRFK